MQILKYKNGHKISSSIFSSTHHYVKSIVWWDDFVENGSLFVLMRQKYIVGKYAINLHNKNARMNLIFIGYKITRKSHPATIIFFPFYNLKCHFMLHIFLSILGNSSFALMPETVRNDGLFSQMYFLWLADSQYISMYIWNILWVHKK